MRILILEDDEAVLHLMKLILSDLSYNHICDGTGSLEVASRLIGQVSYDLILVDLIIDSVPCLDFLRHVRATQPAIRLFVMSGWPKADKVIEGINVDGFLMKPFTLEFMDEMLFDKNIVNSCCVNS